MRRSFLIVFLVVLTASAVVLAAPAHQDGFQAFESEWPNTDFSKSSVPAHEIYSGGPFIDGIPPYYSEGYIYPDDVPFLGGTTPRIWLEFTSIEATNEYLPDEQQVIAVEVNGEAQAYPLVLLNNHEIANAEIGGVPIVVTFCPLCNAAIVYDRRVDGEQLHFGNTGLLRNSDLIMWDHETQSWWQQFTGEAIVGEMTGTQLEQIPSLVVSWKEFKAEYSEARVLKSIRPDPMHNVSYGSYDLIGNPILFQGQPDTRLGATERVLGYFGSEGAVAYPFLRLAEFAVVNDRIGGKPVVVLWQRGSVSLFTNSIETGSAGLYSAVLDDGTELTFSSRDNITWDDQTGSVWNVFGRAIAGKLEGAQLEQLLAYPHFWFAWAAFRPDTLIWEPGLIADEAWGS